MTTYRCTRTPFCDKLDTFGFIPVPTLPSFSYGLSLEMGSIFFLPPTKASSMTPHVEHMLVCAREAQDPQMADGLPPELDKVAHFH